MEHDHTCPVCAAPTRRWVFKGYFIVQKYPIGGHGFALPRPSRIKANRFYMDVALDDALKSESYQRRARVGRFSAHFQSANFEVRPLEFHPLLAGRIEDETGLSVVR